MTIADMKIVVRSNDDVIVFVGTPNHYSIQSDNDGLLKEVKNHLKQRTPVPLFTARPYLMFVSDDSSYIGILAAMFAPNPNNSILLDAPARLLFELREYNNEGIGFMLR